MQDLGITGRGRDAEVGTYVTKTMASELSGNVIDLCPVGALTSKPAAFTYRNWELRTTETVDTSDALGCNIRVDARGLEVMRILPRMNEDINQEWISDKTRFQYDGLRYQRLTQPMIRNSSSGQLTPANWPDALSAAAAALQGVKGNEIRAVAGKLADAESMVALKDLMNRLGCGDLRHEAGFADLDADARSTYLFNSSLRGVDSADAILLVGTNPRKEAPVLNARLRAAAVSGTPVALIGSEVDLTYQYDHLGEGPDALDALLKPASDWSKRLKAAAKPMVVIGAGVLCRDDRDAVLARVHKLVEKVGVVKEGWNGYNVLHDTAGRVAALDVGFLPSARARRSPSSSSTSSSSSSPTKVVYLLGSDDYSEADVPDDAFVIYQGHHGDRGATRADVILPGAAFTEKSGLYVNTEGRTQSTQVAVPVVAAARDDWKVVRALSEVVGKQLPYDSLNEMRERVAEVAPHLAVTDGDVQPTLWLNGEYFKAFADRAKGTALSKEALVSSVDNFYQTDVISRASKVMARCVKNSAEVAAAAAAAGR